VIGERIRTQCHACREQTERKRTHTHTHTLSLSLSICIYTFPHTHTHIFISRDIHVSIVFLDLVSCASQRDAAAVHQGGGHVVARRHHIHHAVRLSAFSLARECMPRSGSSMVFVRSLIFSQTVTQTHTHTHTLTHSLTHTHTHTHSLSHTHTHTHTRARARTDCGRRVGSRTRR
jgi:hypothetical protein